MSVVNVTNTNFDSLGVLAANTTYNVTENINIALSYIGYIVTNPNIIFDFNNFTVTIDNFPLFPGLFLSNSNFTVKNLNLITTGTTDLNLDQGFVLRGDSYNYTVQNCNFNLVNLNDITTGGIVGSNIIIIPNSSVSLIDKCNVTVTGQASAPLIVGININHGSSGSVLTVSNCIGIVNFSVAPVSLIGLNANNISVNCILNVSGCKFNVIGNCSGIIGYIANNASNNSSINVSSCDVNIQGDITAGGGIIGDNANDSSTNSKINVSNCNVNIQGSITSGGGIIGNFVNASFDATNINGFISVTYCNVNVQGNLSSGGGIIGNNANEGVDGSRIDIRYCNVNINGDIDESGGIIGNTLNHNGIASFLGISIYTVSVTCVNIINRGGGILGESTNYISNNNGNIIIFVAYITINGNITSGSGGVIGAYLNINSNNNPITTVVQVNVYVKGDITDGSGGFIGSFSNYHDVVPTANTTKNIQIGACYIVVLGSILSNSGGYFGANTNNFNVAPGAFSVNTTIVMGNIYTIVFGGSNVGIDNTSSGMFGNNSFDSVNTDASNTKYVDVNVSYVAAYGTISDPTNYPYVAVSGVGASNINFTVENSISNFPQLNTTNINFLTNNVIGFEYPIYGPGEIAWDNTIPYFFRGTYYWFPRLQVFTIDPWYNYCFAPYQATFINNNNSCNSNNLKANSNNPLFYNVTKLEQVINKCNYPKLCKKPNGVSINDIITGKSKIITKRQNKTCCK